jgi:hypothetical protein
MTRFAHEAVHRIHLAPAADERAPGGAITVALCGHWDHDGECRWPHHTSVERAGDALIVRTSFDAPAEELDEVRARIGGALSTGTLEGPDGVVSTWALIV